MDISSEELFNSATTDEALEVEVPAEAEQVDQEQPRDDQGRFAAKQAELEAEPQPEVQPQARDEAHVPSWRLREERERADAAERRFQDAQSQWQRQFNDLQARLPKQEPQAAPDVFEDPNKFLQHGVSQAVDPIKSEIGQMREFFSRRDAEREHGAEKVKAAYDWIAQGMQQRDPEAMATYQRAMQSMHPFGDIVAAHQQRSVYQQIGNDPQVWFGKTLDEKLADPKFAGELLQKIQQSARGQAPQKETTIQLAPSLNRVAAAKAASDDDGDASDGAIFSYATR